MFCGISLESWCSEKGVELAHCPGEDHSQIGIVESTLEKIKDDFSVVRTAMGSYRSVKNGFSP